jgi:glycosyltransferase 2 family protein
VLAAVTGLVLIAVLVANFGPGAVTRSLAAIGWAGFVTVCAIHLLLIVVMGTAWAALLPGTRLWVPIWGRLIRDSAAELLPLSQIGGFVLGARAVTIGGVSGTSAIGSTIVDVTLELFSQLAYTALALCWLVHIKPDAVVVTPVVVGLAIAVPLVTGFVAAQRRGFGLFDRIAQVLGHGWAHRTAAGASAVHVAIDGIYRRRNRVWVSFFLHLVCWIASTLEVWVALWFAGAPLGFGSVLTMESLLYATRSVAFAVPNAVGVQEGAYILLGASFGVTPEMALALSLLKRGRDLVLGLPALGSWQFVESGRLWHRVAGMTPARSAFERNVPP